MIDSVLCLEVADGQITAIRVIRNPDKLRHLTTPRAAWGLSEE